MVGVWVTTGSDSVCFESFPHGLLWIPVEDAAAAGTAVHATEFFGIARDVTREAVLVLVVVDAHPGRADVVGAEEAVFLADLADEVDGRVLAVRSRCAEADGVARVRAVDGFEGFSGVDGAEHGLAGR